jgi:dimeric dUTPase (all-alpha-NTP-PPase superfamily)
MDLKVLLEKQKELDTLIFKNAGIKEYPLNKVKLSLLTELGELSNENQCFKYWKKNKTINKEKQLEEFADCLHFALSLENQLHESDIKQWEIGDMVQLAQKLGKINDDEMTYGFLRNYEQVIIDEQILKAVLTTGICLGFTEDEMEQAYLKKYEKNIKRQAEGY